MDVARSVSPRWIATATGVSRDLRADPESAENGIGPDATQAFAATDRLVGAAARPDLISALEFARRALLNPRVPTRAAVVAVRSEIAVESLG